MSDRTQQIEQGELRDLSVPEKDADRVRGGLGFSWRTPNPRREQTLETYQQRGSS